MRLPSPGSHDALRQGCRCDGPVNQYGRGTPETTSGGWPDFALHERCAVHGPDYVWTPPPPDEVVPMVLTAAEIYAERLRVRAKRKAA
jgi:hypothetical protein